jgi:hypothetical protein
LKFTEIKLSGLRDGNHEFLFSLDSGFLNEFSRAFFDLPQLSVKVNLLTSETMIKAEVKIEGQVQLICDRSLDSFSHEVNESVIHFYKFGEEEKELSDEMEIISKERVFIDLDQLVYDTVALSSPSKKLHPRFQSENEDIETDGVIVYSSDLSGDETGPTETIDPIWEKLKDLNR